MALFAVSYDLVERKDYPTLWEEFDRLGAKKALNSFYLVNANNTASEILNHLKRFVDDDDRLIVVEFNKPPARHMVFKGTSDWLDANM